MARKIYYSKPLKYFWRNLYGTQKKFTPEFSDDQIFQILRSNLLSQPLRGTDTIEKRGLIVSGLELWWQDAKGELTHIFFIDKHLKTFLEETPLSDIEGVTKFFFDNGEIKDIKHIYNKVTTKNVIYKFALHLPYESEGYAFSLTLENDESIEMYFSIGENGGRMSNKFYSDIIKKNDDESKMLAKMYRLAINTIAYMNCFPNCVFDGVPQNLYEREINRSLKNYTFQSADIIKENESNSKSKIPHFRKGHFRILKSDYFTNKKGQIVYITDTMVKGKAKTIFTSNDLDSFYE